mmetsp:Transcript_17346/g.41709  ORF Transcript_17346/g.41709 Transcript_17346/m.41709 type:complete len:163 (-) Transcript_17346:94-582(-)
MLLPIASQHDTTNTSRHQEGARKGGTTDRQERGIDERIKKKTKDSSPLAYKTSAAACPPTQTHPTPSCLIECVVGMVGLRPQSPGLPSYYDKGVNQSTSHTCSNHRQTDRQTDGADTTPSKETYQPATWLPPHTSLTPRATDGRKGDRYTTIAVRHAMRCVA